MVCPSVLHEPAVYVWGMEPLTAYTLASTPLYYQKPMPGECLIFLIHKTQPCLADKLTGMFLEMDNDEVIYMLGVSTGSAFQDQSGNGCPPCLPDECGQGYVPAQLPDTFQHHHPAPE